MKPGKPSRTAQMVAYWRALADLGVTSVPRFSDPFARRLLDGPFWRLMLARAERAARDPNGEAVRGIRPWLDGIILRVAFIDAVLAEAGAKQVVILGAGLDTRAWRLESLRGARVFEVDFPATQAYKRERAPTLGPPLAEVSYVPVDFERDDLARALAAAGHDPSRPTAWVWEGVTMYLGDAALRGTLSAVRRASAPGSTLIAHYHEAEHTRRGKGLRRLLFAWLGEPQIGLRPRDVMRAEVVAAGFEPVEDAGLAEQAARTGGADPGPGRLQVSRILVATVRA